MGFPIIAPERIAESGCEAIVVTTVCPTQRIVEQLTSLGLGHIPPDYPRQGSAQGDPEPSLQPSADQTDRA